MSSFHGKQSARTILRLFAALFISGFLLVQSCAPAFAAVTSGIIAGTVTDATTHAPLANVQVSAVAPTGRYQATTNSSGFYSINGVFADTYTISFALNGYEPVNVLGQTVFADLTTTVNETLVKSLKTIARVTSRSAGNAFQPNQTVDTYSITAKQIKTILGNQLNLSESTLITSLPGGSLDSSGYPVIRGGRENEENFEFEGIPTTDAFTNQFTNSQSLPGLGLQSAQLTPGVGNASQDNYGSGTFNLIAKRGQYPGFATGQFAVGWPAFQHLANAEWGFASPNGHFSGYITMANTGQGRTYNNLGYTNCNAIGTCFSRVFQDSRELLGNFILKFGHNNNQQLQLFADSEEYRFFIGQFDANNLCFKTCDPLFLQTELSRAGLAFPALGLGCVSALNCPGYSSPPICPTPPASCATLQAQYANVQLIQGLMDLQTDSGQNQVIQTLGAVGARPQTTFQPDHLVKLGYAWNISPTTFLEAMAYHQDSVVRFNNALSGGYSTSGSARESLQGGKTSGGKIDITSQLSDKHLLKGGARWALLIPVFKTSPSGSGLVDLVLSGNNQKAGVGGELYDFVPAASCPRAPSVPFPTPCGYIYGNNYVVNGVGGQPSPITTPQKVTHAFENTSIIRQDYAAYIDDTWSPNDRLKVEGGIRLDEANFQYPKPVMDLTTCTSSYLPTYSFDSNGNMLTTPAITMPGFPAPQVFYTNPKTGAAQSTGPGNCGVATFNLTKEMKNPIVPEPIISATWRLGPNDSVRASWGRSVEFEILADADFSASPGFFTGPNGAFNSLPAYASPATGGGVNCGIFNDVTCTTYAEQLYWVNANNFAGTPVYNPTRPTVFTNADFSWEHQFTRGILNGIQFKITPWWRKAQDEVALVATPKIFNGQILTDPNTFAVIFNPASANNLGANQAAGVEMQFTKEETYGLSGQVTLNYQNETSSVIPLSGSEDFFPSIPTPSILLGNQYRVGFLSPFSATWDLSYQTHSGWRINPQIQWNVGFPISPGLISSGFINGQPYNVPNTNASLALIASAGGTDQYVDPMNPGSFFSPNVAATRGIPVTSSPGGKLSHPSSTTNLTIEYNAPKTWSAGLQVFNLFGVLHGGPSLNGRWQQLATGISGPLTGQNTTALTFPQYGMSGDFGALRYGRNAYIDTPSGIRRYYFYIQIKM